MNIGIDLDNTIIIYDKVFAKWGRKFFTVPVNFSKDKNSIRNWLRHQPGGETKWTKLQGYVYTHGLKKAQIAPGFKKFLKEALRNNHRITIISHKTKFPELGPRLDMRQSASELLCSQGIIPAGKDDVSVYYALTRHEKIELIKKYQCDIWIDDLKEIFSEKTFPLNVLKIQYHVSANTQKVINTNQNWHDLTKRLRNGDLDKQVLILRVNRLIKKKVSSLTPMNNSLNCRVFKVNTDSKMYLVKMYKQFASDRRNRLQTESYAFKLLRQHSIENVPQVIAVDSTNNIGIYEWIAGSTHRNKLVSNELVLKAISFIKRINSKTLQHAAHAMPLASEASTSIDEYISTNQSRLGTLYENINKSSDYEDAKHFIFTDLKPSLQKILSVLHQISQSKGISLKQKLTTSELIISPSDFGFHNAIINNNIVKFIDFEYFGWDDPAKLIADFSLHPGMSLTQDQKKIFTSQLLEHFYSINLMKRYELVYILLSIKWVLIILNIFVRSTEEFIPIHFQKKQLHLAKLHLERTMIEFEKMQV